MFHKVEEVIPMENTLLKVKFTNKKVKIYDVKPLMKKWKVFEVLKNEELLKKVKVDQGGYGISWNDNIDIECNELWENGTIIE